MQVEEGLSALHRLLFTSYYRGKEMDTTAAALDHRLCVELLVLLGRGFMALAMVGVGMSSRSPAIVHGSCHDQMMARIVT